MTLLGLLVFAVLCQVLLAMAVVERGDRTGFINSMSYVLFLLAFVYLLSIFLYIEIRKGALSEGFPSRLYTLPVRTGVLVAWPMAYGVAALMFLWGAMACLVWLPCGLKPAWWLPPLLAIHLVVFQAVSWALVGSPLVKVLAIEGNKVRLSRKALLREQREKQRREAAPQEPQTPQAPNQQ